MDETILDNVDLDSLEPVDNAPSVDAQIEVKDIPNVNDLEWTAFVLSELKPDECYDGQPTADGLRRLAREYLGVILESKSHVNQSPNLNNGNHTCITHDIKIKYYDRDYLGDLAGETAVFSGVADVFQGNGVDNLFSWRYSSATCQTRAKSRAYKEILNLRNVLTKEEISDIPSDESGMDGYIGKVQFVAVNMMCARLGIDAEKYLKHCWSQVNKGEKSYDDLKNIPFNTAVKALGSLSKFQQDRNSIPDYIKGYKADWLNNYT